MHNCYGLKFLYFKNVNIFHKEECIYLVRQHCLQCFDAVGWMAGRAFSLYKLSGEVLAWLSVCSEVQNDLHMVQLMPLPPHHLLLQ